MRSVNVQRVVVMINGYDMVDSLLKQNNGFVTSAQVTAAGIQRRTLGELVAANRLYRAKRGIYALPEAWEDDMYFLQYRFSKGIFSNETALYLHGFSDRTPIIYTMTFPHGYNASGIKGHTAKAKFVNTGIYDLGLIDIKSPSGNIIRAYDIERTLCDIVKGNNSCDIQLVNQAMKAYASSKKKDMAKLIDRAERLRVKPKILRYMEVLL
jgi:predicted transcriptional regulator of viral defense system